MEKKGIKMGLSEDLKSVGASVTTGEAKSLRLVGLKNEFIHNGDKISYEIKIGKFGPYLIYSLKDENGKDVMRSIPPTLFPGTFNDLDAENLLFPPEESAELLYNRFLLKKGRYGDYFERIEDKETVSWPKFLKKKALESSESFIDLLFSLPKTLGVDKDNNAIVLKVGPFGFYASYKGKNIKVTDPETVSANEILSPLEIEEVKGELNGMPLSLKSGRYGLYIKYGDENIALSKEDKKNPDSLTLPRLKEIVSEYLKKGDSAPKGEKEFEGLNSIKAYLVSGKYGYYLKWGKENIALSKEDKENPLNLSEERVKTLIEEHINNAKNKSRVRRK